jgi:glycosyltransferase involved in cell wall biosynthesis
LPDWRFPSILSQGIDPDSNGTGVMEHDNNDISIALCTYNGECFLQDQLESLANQTLLPKELIVVDDNSTDNTVEILSSFAASSPFVVTIEKNTTNIGPVLNFSKAIAMCKGNYVATCDQDDVWLPEKLENTMKAMRQGESVYGSSTPLLVHTDLRVVVGEERRLLHPSFMVMMNIRHRSDDPIKVLLVQNFVTGCTMLVNRSLVREALPIPPSAVMHDWWFALIAAVRGRILYLPSPSILYRQHSANVAGARNFISVRNFKTSLDSDKGVQKMSLLLCQGDELIIRLKYLKAGIPVFLENFISGWKKGGVTALIVTISSGIKKQGLLRNIYFYFLLLKGNYLGGLH